VVTAKIINILPSYLLDNTECGRWAIQFKWHRKLHKDKSNDTDWQYTHNVLCWDQMPKASNEVEITNVPEHRTLAPPPTVRTSL
jgi:hypothetical protein